MIEKLFKRTRENVVRHGAKPFRWLGFFSPGVWIILGVVAVTGGRWLWLQEHRPAHLENLAAAYGGVRLFQGPPQINHIGSQVTYVATADRGFALFLCNTATGQRHVIFSTEKLGAWGDVNNLQAGPWSPDDSAFIYYASNQLFVCPASGKQPAAPVRNRAGISDVVWLGPTDFVYLVDKTRIGLAQRQTNGLWKMSEVWRWTGPISTLTTVGNRTLAWLAEGRIYRGTLTNGTKLLPVQNAADEATKPPPEAVAVSPEISLPTNGLVLHLDASTLQQSNQTPVILLADLSPRHNDAVQNGHPPVYNAPGTQRALNSRGTIHFASGNSTTNGTGLKTVRRLGLTNALPRTVFAVLRRDNGRIKRMMSVNLGRVGGRGTFFEVSDGPDAIYLPRGGEGLDNKAPAASDNWNLLEVVYDGVSQNGYVHGALKGVTTNKLATVDKEVEIGQRTGNVAAGSDGDFAELLVYDRALSTSERRQVESYLRVKWFGASRSSGDDHYVWLEPELSGMNSFSYARETGKILIHCSDNGRDSIWKLDPQEGKDAKPVRMVQGKLTGDVQWTDRDEFCYQSVALGHSGLVLSDLNGNEKRLFSRGDIRQFQVVSKQRQLLFLGTTTNEPAAGLWQYDLTSGQLRSVVPYADNPDVAAQDNAPMRWSVRLPSGRTVNCTLYPPANFDRHKQYPLVLGNTMFGVAVKGAHGRLWVPGMAASGAFVAIIERAGWFEGIGQWEENVRGVYEQLKRDPCIDTSQVFLFGASAETQYMGPCLEKTPGLWKGAIFLNPTGLPDFTKSPPLASRPKILISVGGEEHQETRLKKYQSDALNFGALVEYVVHPGEMHHLVGNAAQLERTKAMMHFIFEE